MSEIEKPKRTSGKITRSRNEKANRQGKREIEDERYSRLVTFQRAVGIRRAELSRLTGADLVIDEKGYLCVYVERGKGGKTQLQRILPEDEKVVLEMFQSVNPDQKLFSLEEMNNKIDLHGIRRKHARKAYEYYADRLKNEPARTMIGFNDIYSFHERIIKIVLQTTDAEMLGIMYRHVSNVKNHQKEDE